MAIQFFLRRHFFLRRQQLFTIDVKTMTSFAELANFSCCKFNTHYHNLFDHKNIYNLKLNKR